MFCSDVAAFIHIQETKSKDGLLCYRPEENQNAKSHLLKEINVAVVMFH